ncbi:MAG: aminotransferase class III-fold pyridoxal phosphate-dependent enzyme, partial [Chloroflexota bacterium]
MATVIQPDQIVGETERYSRENVLVSWSVQSQVKPLVVTGGKGCWFWDDSGRRYLDFSSQLVNTNVGHQHPRVVEAIKTQADKMCFIAPQFASEERAELAHMISQVAPGDMPRVFFTNGGSEANENAIKLARHYTGRQKIITR